MVARWGAVNLVGLPVQGQACSGAVPRTPTYFFVSINARKVTLPRWQASLIIDQ